MAAKHNPQFAICIVSLKKLFVFAHKNIVAACDFCTYELLTPYGLERRHILFLRILRHGKRGAAA